MLNLNLLYGHRQLLLAYLGRPDRPVHSFVQHGWTLQPDGASGSLASSRRLAGATRLYWSVRQAEEAATDGAANAFAVGAPFLYLLAALELTPQHERPLTSAATESQSVLVYPPHSANDQPLAKVDTGAAEIAAAVEAGCQVTVCLHPSDVHRSDVTNYYNALGCRVTSHGSSIYDPLFLHRQLRSLEKRPVVWAYSMGTAPMYASLMGCRVVFKGLAADDSDSGLPAPACFPGRSDVYQRMRDGLSFAAFVADELGVDLVLPPPDLARLLGVHGWRGQQAWLLNAAGSARRGFRTHALRRPPLFRVQP